MKALTDPVVLVARILLALLFVLSGLQKIGNFAGTGQYMASHGMPAVSLLLPLTILTELGGGLLIVVGLFARPIAILMFLFLIPVTLVFHTAGDANSTVQLLKNTSIAGGMLFLFAHGAGRYSLDARFGR